MSLFLPFLTLITYESLNQWRVSYKRWLKIKGEGRETKMLKRKAKSLPSSFLFFPHWFKVISEVRLQIILRSEFFSLHQVIEFGGIRILQRLEIY